MGYYTRVLTTKEQCIPVSHLERVIAKEGYKAKIEIEDGKDADWTQIVLKHPDGLEIAVIERNPVQKGSLGEEEVAEFIEEIQTCQPVSAVLWLTDYLKTVKAIYAFQHLEGSNHSKGDEILRAISNFIWKQGDAIIQADGEGFSNEDGYHILWQFSDNVKGKWWMGVLEDGSWVHFQMDLGDRKHREAFFAGRVPPGARKS